MKCVSISPGVFSDSRGTAGGCRRITSRFSSPSRAPRSCSVGLDVGQRLPFMALDGPEGPQFVDDEVDGHRDDDRDDLRPVLPGVQTGRFVEETLGEVDG